jgi:hypothetical protein
LIGCDERIVSKTKKKFLNESNQWKAYLSSSWFQHLTGLLFRSTFHMNTNIEITLCSGEYCYFIRGKSFASDPSAWETIGWKIFKIRSYQWSHCYIILFIWGVNEIPHFTTLLHEQFCFKIISIEVMLPLRKTYKYFSF